MILKQTRILVGDGDAFGKYLKTMKEGDDIAIDVLSGNPDLVRLNDLVAAAHKRTYGNRHIIVSPGEILSAKELDIVLDEIRKEFRLPVESFARRVVVRHEKERSRDGDGREFHYHIAIPEVSRDGSVLDAQHNYIRNEVVSRKLELIFEHEIIPGSFNPEVLERLENEAFYISADDFDDSILVVAPEPLEMSLQDEFDAIAAYENNEILVSYNTEPFRNALLEYALDASLSEDEVNEKYRRYRAFSGKKTAYAESAKRLGIDLDEVRSRVSSVFEEINIINDLREFTRKIQRSLRELDFTLTYNEPTRVMFVSAHRIIDNVRHLSRIGTLRCFLGLTQRQFEPILLEILKGNTYDTTYEKPKRDIERSQSLGDLGRDDSDFVSDAGGRDGFRRWRESLPRTNGSDREAAPGQPGAADSDVADDQRANPSPEQQSSAIASQTRAIQDLMRAQQAIMNSYEKIQSNLAS
ncbi:hypothetical protein [Pseudotabrizicola formosa]|uniref:hypothetical protein n=1 Tax=Pseudotabrizicola formosa TaxID=2030009 RepID=UPI0011AF1FF8|nr:hypothetical protein [Pseudotabrizicola formosa]